MLDRGARPGTSAGRDPRGGGARSPSGCAAARAPAVGRDARHRGLSTAPSTACASSTTRANGGFGGAPKFPPASALELLLRRGEREDDGADARAMAAGGIYDQVGGGFARYSVDARWLVPHFEKMLYDNALLARAYLHGWHVIGDPLFRERVTEETLDWALREMRGPGGRLLLRARRGLGGRGGPLLRLDARRGPRRARRRADAAIAHFGDRARATSRVATSPCARARSRPTRDPARRSTRPSAARLAGPRRQAPHRLERARDRRAGRGRAPCSSGRTTSRPPRTCADFVLEACATPTAACCAP